MNLGQFRERVFLRDHEHRREPLQFHPLKPFETRFQTLWKNRDVNLFGSGSLPHRLCGEIGELKKNILVVRLEALKDTRHDPGSEGMNIPNAQLLPLRACFDSSNRDVHPSENILCFFVKSFPRQSQGNGVLAANDKCDSDFVFQALYLAAQGRLRQVQLVCRPAKTSMRGHGGKISQMTKFHTRLLRYYQKYELHQKHGISNLGLLCEP